jgi:hypothetical protein
MDRIAVQEKQKRFPHELNLFFYVPIIGLLFGLVYFGLVLAGRIKCTKRQFLVALGGIISTILYLLIIYLGVKHRRDYDILVTAAFNREPDGNYDNLFKAAFQFYISRYRVYISELTVITALSFLSYFSKKPSKVFVLIQGACLGLLCWLIVIDYFSIEFEYEMSHVCVGMGYLILALFLIIALPVFMTVGAKFTSSNYKRLLQDSR